MGKREDFINSLNNYELAFLYKYKLDSYMPDTRKYIKEVLAKNGINENDIEQLIEERKSEGNVSGGCPRCHSDKFFYFERVYDNLSTKAAVLDDNRNSSEMIMETNQECAVCGYSTNKGVVDKTGKNQVIKTVLIIAAIVYGLVRLLRWIFDI